MNKIKNAFYGATAAAMALAPAIASAQWSPQSGVAGNAGIATGSIRSILTTLLNGLLALVGLLGILGFVISGILYLTAAGDEDQVDRAKKMMMFSIVGVIVALIGYVVIRALDTWLTRGSAAF